LDISEYKELFLAESKELVASLNRVVLELEKSPDNPSLIEEIFRSAHTIKGMSGTMGYQKIVQLTHQLEELLEKIKQAKKIPTEEVIDMLFSSIDLLNRLIDLSGTPEIDEIDVKPFINKIRLMGSSVADMPSFKKKKEKKTKRKIVAEKIDEAEQEWKKYQKEKKKGYTLVRVVMKLAESCQLKGTRAYVICTRAQKLGRIIETVPDFKALKSGEFGLSFQIFLSAKDVEAIEKEMKNIPEVEWTKVESIQFQEIYPDFIPPEKKAPEPKEAKAEKKPEEEISRYLPSETESIRINMRHLNNLMNITGELFILQRRMENLGQQYILKELNDLLDQSARLVNSLQDSIMSARMVPVWQIFNLFPRFIRDTAKEMGKKINYTIEGGDIEIDRMVLDKISEPLIHLIRNSIDHGLETPKERQKARKTEEGLIKVSIARQGYTFLITVEDDGRGLDIDEIKQVSLERGIVSQEELDNLSPEEILYLITKAGYSTSKLATDVSGRGVGLSIVYRSVISLGGSLKIKSEKGKGSQFVIMLPATMAIVKVLLIGVNEETFAIPISYISEIIDRSIARVKGVSDKQILIYRGENYPLLRLKKIFALSEEGDTCSIEDFILIIEVDERKLALTIDSFYKQQEVVVKPFDQIKTSLNCFSGATILGNGHVALIIDPRGLM
jgi:two-component system chemotaxis sensor kinase CheA